MKTVLVAALLMLSGFDPVTVCQQKAVGAPCHVVLSDGDHEGVCLAGPPDEPFTCMPAPPPPPPAAPMPVASR
jgi:hypothetical protein